MMAVFVTEPAYLRCAKIGIIVQSSSANACWLIFTMAYRSCCTVTKFLRQSIFRIFEKIHHRPFFNQLRHLHDSYPVGNIPTICISWWSRQWLSQVFCLTLCNKARICLVVLDPRLKLTHPETYFWSLARAVRNRYPLKPTRHQLGTLLHGQLDQPISTISPLSFFLFIHLECLRARLHFLRQPFELHQVEVLEDHPDIPTFLPGRARF